MGTNVSKEELCLRTCPGHLSRVDFAFPSEPESPKQIGYYNFDFFITVSKDPGNLLEQYPIPEDIKGMDTFVGYYWANQFRFINGHGGYMGIQTIGDISIADPSHRNDATRNQFVKQTRIAIFSIWDSLDARPGPNDSYCAPFGHEGTGWSCKIEYPWREGVKYCLRIWELSDAEKPNEPEWWRGSIIDTTTNQEMIIGDIQVPAQWNWLQKNPHCFTEYYSSTVNQTVADEDDGISNPRVCQYMPKAEVVIYPPQANNRDVMPTSMTPINYEKCAGVSAFVRQQDSKIIDSETCLSPVQSIVNFSGKLEAVKKQDH